MHPHAPKAYINSMEYINEFIIYSILLILLYFQVFLLLTYFERRKTFNIAKELPEILPTVTAIVPCFNEEETLERTVESLLALDYPKEKLTIYLIDDGSTDNTPKLMEKYAAGFSQIKIFHKENGGKWRALNLGIDKTTTELVGCLDADSFVDKNALKELVSYFTHHPEIMAVTPSMRIWQPNTIIRRIQYAEYDLGIFVRKVLSFLGAIHITPGPFSIFRKKVFDILGPYKHAHNTEDLEIALRMQKAGMKIENAHKAIVYTVGPSSPYSLYKQRVRWTGGFLKNMIDYREMFLNRSYGHLSIIILPMTIFSVLTALYFVTLTIVTTIINIVRKIQELKLIGFALPEFNFNFEWFYINTEAVSFIGFALIATTILCIYIGRLISNDKKFITFDLFCFIFLYSFIAPFWLIKSVYNTITSQEAKWR